MARAKSIIKFKDSTEYNFIYFDKGLTIYSTKNKNPYDFYSKKLEACKLV